MRRNHICRVVLGTLALAASLPVSASAASIYGSVDPSILGTCPASTHDRYVVDGGDGYLYRTWHPQTVPVVASNPSVTCTFAHEHGDNPALQQNAEVAREPVRFGYVGRRHVTQEEPYGHDEAHEGFKVFVANRGARNDEGRVNANDSRLVMHMGTGLPRRFGVRMHSMSYRVVTGDDRRMFVQGMADTGGTGSICSKPRQGKTVVTLDSRCRLSSLYEIWQNVLAIRAGGQVVALAIASTAVFDPITVFDPSNPTRTVYVWDAAVNPVLLFPRNDRSSARGCDRESYHGPTFWYNTSGRDVYYTDAMGNETTAGPLALRQEVSRDGYEPFVATSDGLSQFKMRRRYCAPGLGLRN